MRKLVWLKNVSDNPEYYCSDPKQSSIPLSDFESVAKGALNDLNEAAVMDDNSPGIMMSKKMKGISGVQVAKTLVSEPAATPIIDSPLPPSLQSPNLLQCPSSPASRQRRKSPVTVQEWVASLPPPHVMQRREFGRSDVGGGDEEEEDAEVGEGFIGSGRSRRPRGSNVKEEELLLMR
jgi:hypothetical protein